MELKTALTLITLIFTLGTITFSVKTLIIMNSIHSNKIWYLYESNPGKMFITDVNLKDMQYVTFFMSKQAAKRYLKALKQAKQ